MRTLSDARELKPANGRVCCAIGMFDGVHLGHQQAVSYTLLTLPTKA